MLKTKLPDHDASFEPAPRFATEAEIELAEHLRCQLEERYFGPSAALSHCQARSDEVH